MSARLTFLGVTGRAERQGAKSSSRLRWRGGLGKPTAYDECLQNDADYGACQTAAMTQAVTDCIALGSPPGCVDQRWSLLTDQNCLQHCKDVGGTGGSGTRSPYAWNAFDQNTCDAQDEINAVLATRGFQPIKRDCKLGPQTCAAAKFTGTGIPDTCFNHQWSDSDFTPVPVGGGAAPSPTTTASSEGGGGGTLALILLAIGAAGFYAYTS